MEKICISLDLFNGCLHGFEPPKYKAPMPWIGIYVAAASLVCFFAIAADAFIAFRSKKLWFPCKFFTLNAAWLTLLAVTMKMPLDLSTSMGSYTDQLAKLSSTVFMCVVIGNFMPSLGTMADKELFMNITALGILVITVAVNVCIQLFTGVIEIVSLPEHIAVVICMFVLFVLLTFSAFTVATAKKYLELEYSKKHKAIASSEEFEKLRRLTYDELKKYVKIYWMMAETGSPQFVMARSVTCSASGVICFLTAALLAQLETVAVVAGVIGPAFRWFTAIKFKCLNRRSKCYKIELKTESYWIERLVEWKESPLVLQIRSRKFRKLAQGTKDLFLNFCLRFQIVIIVASKLICFISIFFIDPLLSCHRCCNKLWRKLVRKSGGSDNYAGAESTSHVKMDHGLYVLLLEHEEKLPGSILKNISDAADGSINMGKKQQPRNLMELLQKSTCFQWKAEFHNDQVLPLHSQKPPNSWALQVVTLTSIAIAIHGVKNNVVDQLLRSVSEGLLYVKLVEESTDVEGSLANIRNAADHVWLGVELYHKWFDEDLYKIALEAKSPGETLQTLVDVSKNIVMKYKRDMNGGLEDNATNWPVKVKASCSMYKICSTLLLGYEEGSTEQYSSDELFEKLSGMIGSTLGACLTNLPGVIKRKCFSSVIEKREKSVQHAARLLGETEEILKFLQQHELPCLNVDEQVANIDEWHAKMAQKNAAEVFTVASGSSELPIDVVVEM